MKDEHIQKEKEYGIDWRSAYKKEMFALVKSVMESEEHGTKIGIDDPFIVLRGFIKH